MSNVALADSHTILRHDFEDGTTQGWGPRGDVTVEAVTEAAQSGAYSLKTTGRSEGWHGPSLNVLGLFWGMADGHTWLTNRPITRVDRPLLFDQQLQAKYAYWGIIDPETLPVPTEELDVFRAKPHVDGMEDDIWSRPLRSPPMSGSRVPTAPRQRSKRYGTKKICTSTRLSTTFC